MNLEELLNKNNERIKDAENLLILAKKLFSDEDYEQALHIFNKYLKLIPNNSEVYCDRAECFYSLHNKKFFIRDLTYAITTNNGKELKYWEKRADGYYRIGDIELAEKDVDTIKKLFNKIFEPNSKKYTETNNYKKNNDVYLTNDSLISDNFDDFDENDTDNFIEKLEKQEAKLNLNSDYKANATNEFRINKMNITQFKYLILKLINSKFSELYRAYNSKFEEIEEQRITNYEKFLDDKYDTIENPEILLTYIQKFGKSNVVRFIEAFKKFENIIKDKSVEIYDWGVGFNFSTSLYVENLTKEKIKNTNVKFTLIDSSVLTSYLQRLHLKLFNNKLPVRVIPKHLNQLIPEDFANYSPKNIKIHFFSNIFNSNDFDSSIISEILSNFKGMNLVVCLSSNEKEFKTIDNFVYSIAKEAKKEIISNIEQNIQPNKWRGNKFSNIFSSNILDNYFDYKQDIWQRKEFIFHYTV